MINNDIFIERNNTLNTNLEMISFLKTKVKSKEKNNHILTVTNVKDIKKTICYFSLNFVYFYEKSSLLKLEISICPISLQTMTIVYHYIFFSLF
jgi:malate/lactate dehydrogenase